MKIDIKIEFKKKFSDKLAFIYKLEQNQIKNNEVDIRDISIKLNLKLFDIISKYKLDTFYFFEEVTLIKNGFKILLYIFSTENDHVIMYNNILSKETILEKVKIETRQITDNFLRNNYHKIAKTFFDILFIKCGLKKMGNFYIYHQLSNNYFKKESIEKNENIQNNKHKQINNKQNNQSNIIKTNYFFGYSIENKKITLSYSEINNGIFYIIIKISINSGILFYKEISPNIKTIKAFIYPTNNLFKKTKNLENKYDKCLYTKDYLSEVIITVTNKNKITINDTYTKHVTRPNQLCEDYITCYPTFIMSKSKKVMPFLINNLIYIMTSFNNFQFNNKINLGIFINLENIELSEGDKNIIKFNLFNYTEEASNALYLNVHKLIGLNKNNKIYNFMELFEMWKNNERIINEKSQGMFVDVFNLLSINLYFMVKVYDSVFIGKNDGKVYIVDNDFAEIYEEKVNEFYLYIDELHNNINYYGEEDSSRCNESGVNNNNDSIVNNLNNSCANVNSSVNVSGSDLMDDTCGNNININNSFDNNCNDGSNLGINLETNNMNNDNNLDININNNNSSSLNINFSEINNPGLNINLINNNNNNNNLDITNTDNIDTINVDNNLYIVNTDNLDINSNNVNIIPSDTNVIMDINSNNNGNNDKKKAIIKSYNEKDILLRNSCKTDYGYKQRKTKNQKIKRTGYKSKNNFNTKLDECNKNLYETLEESIINGNYNNNKKLIFDLHIDKESFFNNIKNKYDS